MNIESRNAIYHSILEVVVIQTLDDRLQSHGSQYLGPYNRIDPTLIGRLQMLRPGQSVGRNVALTH